MELDFAKLDGLLPAVVQDHATGEVLMLGFLNAEAIEHTQRTGEVHFYSRTRKRLWKKGETSGHVLRVRQLLFDCDADSLLLRVDPVGPGVCHEGYRSCFSVNWPPTAPLASLQNARSRLKMYTAKRGRNERFETGHSQGKFAGGHG